MVKAPQKPSKRYLENLNQYLENFALFKGVFSLMALNLKVPFLLTPCNPH